jgi:hypothetical protein
VLQSYFLYEVSASFNIQTAPNHFLTSHLPFVHHPLLGIQGLKHAFHSKKLSPFTVVYYFYPNLIKEAMKAYTIYSNTDILREEQLKGARMMVYFRWSFVSLIAALLLIQMLLGHKAESMYSVVLVVIYFVSNLALWQAVKHKYNPRYLGFLSALLDVGIIAYHIHGQASHFDHTAATAAATTFVYPIVFLLYTFRLDRKLLYFLIIASIIGFNWVYFSNYISSPELYQQSLSLSPTSHLFKTVYLLFIGLLCVYLQYSMSKFIEKQITEATEKGKLDMKIKIEQERNLLTQQHLAQEKLLIKRLEKEIDEKEAITRQLQNAKEEMELMNRHLEQTVEQRTLELTKANTQLLKLQKENLQSQFEVLKQQVNPHFLFNSLNVLTSLIKVDPDLAEKFTERLSKVYRYVLENKDKDLVTLTTEMDFLRAYVFLIDIRFQGKVFVNINFNEKETEGFVVPLALQLLIENAIKHNTFSKKSPLHVTMFVDNKNFLNVMNNLQSRETQMVSTGVGLANISKRYALLSEEEPVFELNESQFIAKIPLIKKEKNITDL